MSFLPDGYERPKSQGQFMKLEKGKNEFRVLSPATVGWEYWTTDDKPVRVADKPEGEPANIKKDKDGNWRIKHFWAFAVWNYGTERVELLQINQVSIMDQMESYILDDAWGDPKEYDIKIKRDGDGLETKYSLTVNPKSEISKEILQAFEESDIDPKKVFKSDEDKAEDDYDAF